MSDTSESRPIRNARMFWARVRGATFKEIAMEFGLSLERARQIVYREDDRRRQHYRRIDIRHLKSSMPETDTWTNGCVVRRLRGEKVWCERPAYLSYQSLASLICDETEGGRYGDGWCDDAEHIEFLHALALIADSLGIGATIR